MDHFELHSEYKPTGDQPQAIAKLVKGFKEVYYGECYCAAEQANTDSGT